MQALGYFEALRVYSTQYLSMFQLNSAVNAEEVGLSRIGC